MESLDTISRIGTYTFCLNVLPYTGYADQCYCLMRSLNSSWYKMWKKYEDFLVGSLLCKRKLSRIYNLFKYDDTRVTLIMKLFRIFIHIRTREDSIQFLKFLENIQLVSIYRAEIENYGGDDKELVAKIMVYYSLLMQGVAIKGKLFTQWALD